MMLASKAMEISPNYPYVVRRPPRQPRTLIKIQQVIEAAETVIAKKGIVGATMTEIAIQANTSIGAIYQYFLNKELLIDALRAYYLREMKSGLMRMAARHETANVRQFSEGIVSFFLSFVARHCAYRQLFFSAVHQYKSIDDDKRIVALFEEHFARHCVSLTQSEVRDVSETSLVIIKGLLDAGERLHWEAHMRLIREAKYALLAYLSSRLQNAAVGENLSC